MVIEIDEGIGFCFGVTRAIGKAEEELSNGKNLYCRGDIVHNGKECNRLQQLRLITIRHQEFNTLKDANVLLRAHGEPPSTYQKASENNIHIIDATCPVVLHLQERIRKEYLGDKGHKKQIVSGDRLGCIAETRCIYNRKRLFHVPDRRLDQGFGLCHQHIRRLISRLKALIFC
jgi:4-hydroxy-3-methylbut-2-enyl diphosphate reductase IspH